MVHQYVLIIIFIIILNNLHVREKSYVSSQRISYVMQY